MASQGEPGLAQDNSFDQLFASSTLTHSGVNVATSTGPRALATASDSPPAMDTPADQGTSTTTSDSPRESSSAAGPGIPSNIRNLLIGLGCAVAFILVLVTFLVWYRARRRSKNGVPGLCARRRKTDSYYRQLHSPSHGGGWESRNVDASDRRSSMQCRSESSTPVMMMVASPLPNIRPVVVPAPARLNTTFIGRERNNNLVRASLNRHQLSTLDEHSLYEYESELVPSQAPPMPEHSLQTITISMRSPPSAESHPSTATTTTTTPVTLTSVNELDPTYAVAPLQPRKLELPRPDTSESWTTAPSQPGTPTPSDGQSDMLYVPGDAVAHRFRSVDHWADYQSRMAQRDRSMTSGEYSQAFRDRDSTTSSVGRRDSNSTIAVFRYHPGEEVQWHRPDASDPVVSPLTPTTPAFAASLSAPSAPSTPARTAATASGPGRGPGSAPSPGPSPGPASTPAPAPAPAPMRARAPVPSPPTQATPSPLAPSPLAPTPPPPTSPSSSLPPSSLPAPNEGAATGSHPVLQSAASNQEIAQVVTYQPFHPPRRLHSAKISRAASRYHHAGAGAGAGAGPSTSSGVDWTSEAPSDPDASVVVASSSSPADDAGPPPSSSSRRIVVDPATLQKKHESEATVFNYHPGQEVKIDRADKIKSEDLDAWFGPPSRTVSR